VVALAAPDSSTFLNAKPVEPVSFYLCKSPPQLITILKSDLDKELLMAPASVVE
jgi:hypothetical protein